QAKSRYITGISHELRTPLNSILGYAQLLDNDVTLHDSTQQAIRVIRRSGEHLLSLIEGTLDIARIEAGKLTFDIKPLKFPEFIRQIVSMFELQARNKGLTFDHQISGELPAVVRADHKRLSQILINILGNAVKFTQQGGVSFRVRHAREMVQFEIEDSGPGIPPDELEQVFEPFLRGSAAHGIGGTGLGLTISKLLTELMGGELRVDSRPNRGTTFGIRLFLPQVRQTQELESVVMARRTGYQGARRRVLVVDNEPVDRRLLSDILQPLGFVVAEAATGHDCLRILPRFNPDLVLMDLAMPAMDGWETSYLIRKMHRSDLHIGIVSANAFDKGMENMAGITAADFIFKPVNVQELLGWIGERLGLQWITEGEPPGTVVETSGLTHDAVVPAQEQLDELLALVRIGHLRGITRKLDELMAADDRHDSFVRCCKEMVQQFQLEALKHFIKKRLAGE
ncbi:MAG: response regulator, partial [Pseudomonadales bacterium]|nr:response regulator [Pseudomonadales bacterium]